MRKAVGGFWLVALLVLTCGPRLAEAHPALFTSAQIYIQPDGKFQLFTTFDLLAFALQKTSLEIGDPPMNALLDGPPDVLARKIEDSQAYFLAHIKLQTDQGAGVISRLQYPTLEDVEKWKASGRKPRLPVVARVEVDGNLPQTASTVQFQFPVCMGTVVLTVDRPGNEIYDEPIDAGSVSSAIPIRLDRSPGTATPSQPHPASGSRVWFQYVGLGIRSIIPEGVEHVFFILGLFLAGTRLSSLLWQVIAFTLGHSIALALSLYGVFSLPASVVEPGIALSIVFIGITNLRSPQVDAYRLLAVLGFGLIHGLGFANTFRKAGWPEHDFFTAVVGFNFGIEMGELIVIALAFLVFGWFRTSPLYGKWVVIPGSLLIAVIATCWFFQRVIGYL